MGGSRRRLKRNAPKVRVGMAKARRRPIDKTRTPLEVAQGNPSVEKKLNQSITWSEEATLTDNYKANAFLLNANKRFGRNANGAMSGVRDAEDKQAAGEETFEDDDELRAGCNLERKTGTAPPPRLTATQKAVVSQLLSKHGDDVEAMVLDIKLNKMQHSAGQLKKLIEGFHHWGDGSRHDFRAPRKQPRHVRI